MEFFSDVRSMDLRAYYNVPNDIIRVVRNWLRAASNRTTIPSARLIQNKYTEFCNDLPDICDDLGFVVNDIPYIDFANIVEVWLKSLEEET